MEAVSLLIWVAIALFVASIKAGRRAPVMAAVGWLAFGAYWLGRLPIYLDENSAIKIALSVAALPLSAYVALLVYRESHDVLMQLSQMVAAMGLVYLPFEVYEPLSTALIEHTAMQTYRVQTALGVDVALERREGLENLLVVTNPETGETYRTYIILACTGIGAMSMFAGVIAAVQAPLAQKMKALAVAVPAIYLMNLVRNVFISTAYGHQWFPHAESLVIDVVGGYEGYASFFWADKVISQGLAVVALVGLLLVVVRFLPEVMEVVDDTLEVLGLAPQGDS
ncbi:MAG: archaeosortase A [Halobacteriota archaeon]